MTNFEVERAYKYVVITTIIALLSTLFNHSVIASINEAFTYQGKIVNTDGTNVTNSDASCVSEGSADSCDFRISLYTASSGGTLVWQETKSNVELYDNDSVINLVLDCGGTFSSCNQNGGPDFTSGQLYLEVEFDPDGDGDFAEGETFDPRRELTSVPYSFQSKNADALDNISSSGFLRSNSSDTFEAGYTMTFNGTVDLNSDISIADTDVAFDGANTNLSFTGDMSINIDDFYVKKSNGYAGIGTTNPNSALEVVGNITLGNQNWLGLDSSAARIEFINDTVDKIALMDAYTGIGTTNPGSKLEIVDTTSQLRLSYDSSNYTELNTNVSGYLNIKTNGSSNFFMGVDPLNSSYSNLWPGGVIPDETNYAMQTRNDGQETWWNVGDSGYMIFTIGNTATDAPLLLKNDYVGVGYDYNDSIPTLLSVDGNAYVKDALGIGVTSPTAALDILNGDINITRNDSSDAILSYVGDSNGITWSSGIQDSKNGDFIISEGANLDNPKLLIQNSTGLVSIGSTAPNAFLDLPGSTTDYASLRINTGSQPTTSPASGDIYSDGSNLYFYDGSGWDTLNESGASNLQAAYEAGNTLQVNSSTGNLDIEASDANIQFTIGEGADTGDFKIWDGAQNWLLVDEDADTVVLGTAAGGGITIDAQTGQVDLGTSNYDKQINIATGGSADTLNLATDATAGDTINIGNSNAATTMQLTGGDDWFINTSGQASFGSVEITTGALAVNSDSITSDGAVFTINAGGTVNIQDNLDIGGSLTGVTNLTSSGDWTWTAASPQITINSSETFTITDGTDTFSINTTDSEFSLTDGTNSMAFDLEEGPVYAGTARPTRQITLSPEFQGASFTGDGSNNSGTMTSDFCENGAHADIPDTNTGVCNTSGDIHNYYSWTTSEASAQDYDIWVRWRVPDNFSAWAASNPVKVNGKRTDSTNNAVTVYVYDTSGAIENSGGTQVAGDGTWAESTLASSFSGTYTAGSYMTFRIVMTADTGGDSVQVGEISLDYLTTN